MPALAVAAPSRAHSSLANAFRRRNRAVSEAAPPPPPEERAQLPKAASYTYFPRVKDLDQQPPVLELKGIVSEEELNRVQSGERTREGSSGGSSPTSEEPSDALQMPQLRPRDSRRSSRFNPFSSKSREPSVESKSDRKADRIRSQPASRSSSPAPSPAKQATKLRRKSWIVNQQQQQRSRPTSPARDSYSKKKASNENIRQAAADPGKRKSRASAVSIPEEYEARDSVPTIAAPPPALISKKNKRLSGFFSSTEAPSVPSVPKSFSTEKLPLTINTQQSPLSPTTLPPLPRNVSSDKLKSTKTEPRKKDELWSAFRTLDADLRKFQAKSIALKANVVRTTLIPFLRTYANHPSNHQLRPEDLDRRAHILNGWWTGLLELVAGRNNQSITGTDRPAILDGIAGIMERPEWRLSPSPFCALADRVETGSTTTVGSASSSSSDFLAESVYHNVRNIFTQNLLSQMAFVVDKMAPRNAAASLVTFCGKTCAYAFCFCPGIADVLIRLWNPSLDMMKRVLEESGVSKSERLDVVSDRVLASFPPMLQSLKFHSLTKTLRALRKPATPPLGTANLDWNGLWTKRWSGAESDLFYVFTKYYHILVSDFLPEEPTHAERICIPGLIMVHTQILVNMDATINRHATPQQTEDSSSTSTTFDDVLGDPDASASTVAILPANATRQMQENRVIMLIRDFLSERNSHLRTARRMFAEGFARLLQAQARKVSIYDSSACYTLCDFLEEAFAIMVRYEQFDHEHHSVLNWPFWLSVCRSMTSSHNTATEIKLFSFLYTSWPTLTFDEERKSSLCLDFLLEPEFFESRFNHWCPMVRSYFMRLICWRLARYDGDETDVEVEIKRALSDRLRSVWSHYLYLHQDAERRNITLPSTQACNPAPGRRFLIIRNDTPISASNGPFLSFDGAVQNLQARKLSPLNPLPDSDTRSISNMSVDSFDFPDDDPAKGRWNILRSFIGGSGASAAAKQANARPNPLAAYPLSAAKVLSSGASIRSVDTMASDRASIAEHCGHSHPTHRAYSFRFSLEWVDKRFGTYQNMRLQPPRLPLPAQSLLQSRAINLDPVAPAKPLGASTVSSRYAGRALAEWTFVSHECQNFFERRKNEGVPGNREVETPSLSVEAFRRPG